MTLLYKRLIREKEKQLADKKKQEASAVKPISHSLEESIILQKLDVQSFGFNDNTLDETIKELTTKYGLTVVTKMQEQSKEWKGHQTNVTHKTWYTKLKKSQELQKEAR